MLFRSTLCLIRFSLSFAPAPIRGDLLLAIPGDFVAQVHQKSWSHNAFYGHDAVDGDPGMVELVAKLAEVEAPAEEVRQLQVGDVLTTDRGVDELLEVTVDGVAKFRARPGALDGHKAIRLE